MDATPDGNSWYWTSFEHNFNEHTFHIDIPLPTIKTVFWTRFWSPICEVNFSTVSLIQLIIYIVDLLQWRACNVAECVKWHRVAKSKGRYFYKFFKNIKKLLKSWIFLKTVLGRTTSHRSWNFHKLRVTNKTQKQTPIPPPVIFFHGVL